MRKRNENELLPVSQVNIIIAPSRVAAIILDLHDSVGIKCQLTNNKKDQHFKKLQI